jgi:DNA-binding transcriptional ArsR family regulator
MDKVFKALADETRRAILDELLDRDGQTLYELMVRLVMKHQAAMSRQALVKHLAILQGARLVRRVRRGKYMLYHLNRTPIGELGRRWISRFARRQPRRPT